MLERALVPLTEFVFDAWCSPGAEIQAAHIAGRVVRAQAFLSDALGMTPRFALKVLSTADWSSHTTVQPYGMPHAARGDLIVGTEPSSFWSELAVLFGPLGEAERVQLAAVYGEPPRFGPFADFVAVHELAHFYHMQAPFRFPRLWLQEFFANLCMYAFAVEAEPDALPLVAVGPRLLFKLGATVAHRSLLDFESLYSGVGAANYCWYQFRLTALAERLYEALGTASLSEVFRRFQHCAPELSDGALLDQLELVHPLFAEGIRNWPT